MATQGAFPLELASLDVPVSAFFGAMDFNVGPAHVTQLSDWIVAGEVGVALHHYDGLTHALVSTTDEPPGTTMQISEQLLDDLVEELLTSAPGHQVR